MQGGKDVCVMSYYQKGKYYARYPSTSFISISLSSNAENQVIVY